jgi:hypothetical protein
MPRFENLEPLIDDAKPFHGFVAKPFHLGIEESHRFAHAVETMINCFESDIHMAPELREFLPPAVVLVEPPVDFLKPPIQRREQLLIRHKLTLPRRQPSVKKVYVV